LQVASGTLGFVNGEARQAWLLWLHGIGAYALILLLWWKGAVVWNVLRRGQRWTWARISFLLAVVLLLLTLALGLLWTFGGPRYLWGFSLVSLHIYTAVPLILLLLFHIWRKRWILRVKEAVDRRAFLRLAAAGLAGALAWQVARLWQGRRRFTGSYEVGSMGGRFPYVSWINDNPAPLNVRDWRLTVAGDVQQALSLDYEALLQMPWEERVATIDCTGGWYSEQVWRGVPLRQLLAQAGSLPGARSVLLRSVTGYYRRFSLDEALGEAGGFMLATHVAGAPLEHGHGFPARLVAPGLRGFEWVKWVTDIHLDAAPAWLQPPLPLQ
jgi:DMSO/TMAO reductase YedYZ molybdopterin-dependent catalytic subunit